MHSHTPASLRTRRSTLTPTVTITSNRFPHHPHPRPHRSPHPHAHPHADHDQHPQSGAVGDIHINHLTISAAPPSSRGSTQGHGALEPRSFLNFSTRGRPRLAPASVLFVLSMTWRAALPTLSWLTALFNFLRLP
eukprot:6210611-Pleurochrysis_carterae.AAC.4